MKTKSKMNFITFISLAIPIFIFASNLLHTASKPSSTSWEVGFFFSLPVSGMNDQYSITHSPLVYNYTVTGLQSSVTQTLHIKAKNAWGGTVMVNLLPAPTWGVQLLLNSTRINLEGQDNTYSFDLAFSYQPYPDYKPFQVHRSWQGELEDTSGSLTMSAASLNLFSRFYRKKKIRIDLSAGLTLFKLKGRVSPVTYIYHGFARDILVSIPYNGDNTIDTSYKAGVNAGTLIHIGFFKSLSLSIDCRYFFLPGVNVDISPLEHNGSSPLYGLSNIADADYQSIQITASFLRLAAGFTINL